MTEGKAFEGWAVLELMGHRRLGGFVRETVLAGAGVLRIDLPSYCTSDAGSTWCPEHGACCCIPEATEPVCPLHGFDARHAAEGCEFAATQFYAPSALYCLTPTTEAEARRAARQARPQPFVNYEAPNRQPLLQTAAPEDDGLDDEYSDDEDDDGGEDTGEDELGQPAPPSPESQADGHRDPDPA